MKLKYLAKEDRPREKLLDKGSTTLTDAELLAIILGTGDKNLSALEMAQSLLYSVDFDLRELSLRSPLDLCKLCKGVGVAKSVSISAAIELGKRHFISKPKKKEQILSSEDAFNALIHDLSFAQYEIFQVLLLSKSHRILKRVTISEGGLSKTLIDPKKIFKAALKYNTSSIILGHNHPSGNLKPSKEDVNLTRHLKKAAEVLEIDVLDHIIVSGNEYYSFTDNTLL